MGCGCQGVWGWCWLWGIQGFLRAGVPRRKPAVGSPVQVVYGMSLHRARWVREENRSEEEGSARMWTWSPLETPQPGSQGSTGRWNRTTESVPVLGKWNRTTLCTAGRVPNLWGCWFPCGWGILFKETTSAHSDWDWVYWPAHSPGSDPVPTWAHRERLGGGLIWDQIAIRWGDGGGQWDRGSSRGLSVYLGSISLGSLRPWGLGLVQQWPLVLFWTRIGQAHSLAFRSSEGQARHRPTPSHDCHPPSYSGRETRGFSLSNRLPLPNPGLPLDLGLWQR